MILVLDNFDSFVHNVARYTVQAGGGEVQVRRSADLSLAEIRRLAPSHLVVSPGPGRPPGAGISVEAVRAFAPTTPVLGVCLGHQVIAEAFGGRTIAARHPLHGRASDIHHDGRGLFTGLPDPFVAGRYHSLVVDPEVVPGELEVTARSGEGEIMGLRHRSFPVWGVQFHPESILTEGGEWIFANFLRLASERSRAGGNFSPKDATAAPPVAMPEAAG
ncbi:MAG: aminodeoxychorismate/anthranilate synthase component II [Gemmatimonadota bacterium]